MTDPATDACRRVRDEIVERSGGFDGFFNSLEELTLRAEADRFSSSVED